ncbi:hypothetical protein XENOCAPTIV_023994, partial [Xenoophorus captivus]
MDFLFLHSEFLACLFLQRGQLPPGLPDRASYQLLDQRKAGASLHIGFHACTSAHFILQVYPLLFGLEYRQG